MHRLLPQTLGWLWLVTALTLAVNLPGCSRSTEQKGEQAKAPVPKIEFERVRTVPNDGAVSRLFFKPGHWASIAADAISHQDDFQGRYAVELANHENQQLAIHASPYWFEASRRVVLPKGQTRTLEAVAPVDYHVYSDTFNQRYFGSGLPQPDTLVLRCGLLPDRTFGNSASLAVRMTSLAPHQYYMVVLAEKAGAYAWLREQPIVRATYVPVVSEIELEAWEENFRLIAPRKKSSTILPANPLAWTSTAFLIWDGWFADELPPDQQQALVDWLYWGGQLIISGPNSHDSLRRTFLEPYLPARGSKSRRLAAAAVERIAEYSDPVANGDAPLNTGGTWLGIDLELTDGATCPDKLWFENRPLLAERRVGRGRVAMTAFSLDQRELRRWAGFDDFFRRCLLRVAKRTVPVRNPFQNPPPAPHPAYPLSHVRYFSRDARHIERAGNSANRRATWEDSVWDDELRESVAAWNDDSPASIDARDALSDGARIEVPDKGFVIRVLCGYLFVLVPLNWLWFRGLRRVEWAWAAVPAIALGSTAVVAWLAQLDIGFSKARSEIAVIETEAGHRRAHVTRYTALYNSLTTEYQLDFAEPSALALPLANQETERRGATARFEMSRRTARAGEGDIPIEHVLASGFYVPSNSTRMLHSEQMFELGGTFELHPLGPNRYRVVNGTRLAVERAMLCGGGWSAWVGRIEPGESRTVEALPEDPMALWNAHPSPSSDETGLPGIGSSFLIPLAIEFLDAAAGEVCLIGTTEGELPGVELTPAVSRARSAQLIVAHLVRDQLPEPRTSEAEAAR